MLNQTGEFQSANALMFGEGAMKADNGATNNNSKIPILVIPSLRVSTFL